MESPTSYFTHLPDTRIEQCKEHLNAIEDYGKAKEAWLRQYLRYLQSVFQRP
ncbi:MAG: hypothetical protein LBS54_07895 [Dysgonamonadaceae bacterium]|jgi:hypothetical protein|nr:hypothetical protein [Dysgonamonadaceae bacterium]